MKKSLITAGVFILIAGCSSMNVSQQHTPEEWEAMASGTYQPPKKEVVTPHLSREEWLAVTTRNYEGVTKEQVIEAAESVLRLAGGKYCQCRLKMSSFCRNKMSPDCRFYSERFSGSGCSSSPFGEGPNMPAFRFSLSL